MKKTVIHSNSYALYACSPHFAAERDGITIDLTKIIEPVTDNHLVVEGGGVSYH
jgi:dethiobiotin synthetase